MAAAHPRATLQWHPAPLAAFVPDVRAAAFVPSGLDAEILPAPRATFDFAAFDFAAAPAAGLIDEAGNNLIAESGSVLTW